MKGIDQKEEKKSLRKPNTKTKPPRPQQETATAGCGKN